MQMTKIKHILRKSLNKEVLQKFVSHFFQLSKLTYIQADVKLINVLCTRTHLQDLWVS